MEDGVKITIEVVQEEIGEIGKTSRFVVQEEEEKIGVSAATALWLCLEGTEIPRLESVLAQVLVYIIDGPAEVEELEFVLRRAAQVYLDGWAKKDKELAELVAARKNTEE